jgi:hypothetical protein
MIATPASPSAGESDVARGPLRRIVDFRSLPLGTGTRGPIVGARCGHEVLECGHVRLPREDMIGPTNAVRRRCRACADGEPPHVEIEPGRGAVSDYLATPPVHPCLECGSIYCECPVSIGDHTTTVDMWKVKFAIAEARIAEQAERIAQLEAHEMRLHECRLADQQRIAELEYIEMWAHLSGLDIKDAEERANNVMCQLLDGLLYSRAAILNNRDQIRRYLVDQFKEQAARIAELTRELAETENALATFNDAYQEQGTHIAELETEQHEDHCLRESMADKLTRIANVVKGPPPPLTLHSWHDLPEVVEKRLVELKEQFEFLQRDFRVEHLGNQRGQQRIAELCYTLQIVRDYLRTGKWDQKDGVDNVISTVLEKK